MVTCKKCKKKFKTSMVIDGIKRYLGQRSYCIECSPLGQKNARMLNSEEYLRDKIYIDNGFRRCDTCNEIKPFSEFRTKKGKKMPEKCCKSCRGKKAIKKSKIFKKQCVDYKGGKCEICGYDKYAEVLDFHHTDPSQKELNLNKMKLYDFNEKITKELDKCKLLCGRCHREEHARMKGIL